jgi:hypothetical protein
MDELYSLDPGWGGAHITMTSFQDESDESARSKFKQLRNSLRSGGSWHPNSWSAESKSSGVVRLGLNSQNLDHMPSHFSKAGFVSPTTKGNWHITLAKLTGHSFKKGDSKYNYYTPWFSNMPENWAVVLVSCYKDSRGNIRFHRQNGFTVKDWKNNEMIV